MAPPSSLAVGSFVFAFAIGCANVLDYDSVTFEEAGGAAGASTGGSGATATGGGSGTGGSSAGGSGGEGATGSGGTNAFGGSAGVGGDSGSGGDGGSTGGSAGTGGDAGNGGSTGGNGGSTGGNGGSTGGNGGSTGGNGGSTGGNGGSTGGTGGNGGSTGGNGGSTGGNGGSTGGNGGSTGGNGGSGGSTGGTGGSGGSPTGHYETKTDPSGSGQEPNDLIPVCCVPSATEKSRITEGFNLLNQHRIANGKSALAYDAKLEAAIEGHCHHMVVHSFFAHDAPEASVSSPWTRANLCGTSANGENIYYGSSNPANAMNAWINSPGHNQNMLGNFKRVGIGNYNTHWGQLFGS